MSEPSLTNAIAACWEADPERVSHLVNYLWAAARCADGGSQEILRCICDAWATLPNEELENGAPSVRNSLASGYISWGFQERLPVSALHYFIKQAEREELCWPITLMLRGVDHPDAAEFFAREAASHGQNGYVFHVYIDQWSRGGQEMSYASRQRLQELWQNEDNNRYLRNSAFALWATTIASGDIEILQSVADFGVLEMSIFSARVKRGDSSAVATLLEKLKNEPTHNYWVVLGKHIESDKLCVALQEHFKHRRSIAPLAWGENYETDSITSTLLMYLDAKIAEALLVEHWDHLKFSPYFVQAALYAATSRSCKLVRETVLQYFTTDRNKIFKNISWRFGIKEVGHPGINRIEQIVSLVPYLDNIAWDDIFRFWALCNDKAWFDFRREHLDARLETISHIPNLGESNTPKIFKELDTMVKNGGMWADIWVNKYRDQGEELDHIFATLMHWLKERQNILTLSFVAKAVIYAGKRSHLKLLYTQNVNPPDIAEAIIADTTFAVSRRSLI